MTSFAAKVRQWNEKQKRNTQNILRTATQEVLDVAQRSVAQGGNMPVDLEFLRDSLASGIDGSFGPEAPDSYILTIAGFKAGQVANFAWTAPYARARHYKPESFGQGGGMWRDKAAADWQQIVSRVAKSFI